MTNKPSNTTFYAQIVHSVNKTMISTYFKIGRRLIEEHHQRKFYEIEAFKNNQTVLQSKEELKLLINQ